MDGDNSEPVTVFVRIRPELDEHGHLISPMKSVNTSWSSVSMNSRGQRVLTNNGEANNFCKVIDSKSLKITAPDGVYGSRKSVSAIDDKLYTFDRIFPEDSTQEEIYQHVGQHVEATVRGYNTTIFAYGATGSGKSYTMTGDKHAPGIIPRAIGDLFRHIERSAATESDVFFYVRLSYVELYNNNFRNLLENVSKERCLGRSLGSTGSTTGSVNLSISGFFTELDDVGPEAAQYEAQHGTSFAAGRASSQFAVPKHPGFAHRTDKIEVRDSQQGAGVFLAGPNLRFPVTSAMEAYQLIARGNKYRHVGVTQCNDVSSRSHAILTLHVESRVTANTESGTKSELRLGKMHLVDLAGSERLALSKAEGETLHETQNINLSLTHLGDVLNALSKNAMVNQKQQKMLANGDANYRKMPALAPVPYRNSKLTHLLKDSLGGNSKTIMITNIRTTDEYFQQTQISLDYATRAKKVRNRSLVNRDIISGDTGIHTVNTEIERLKKSLEERQSEFDRLQQLQQHDAKENNALKSRLQEMNAANEAEKRQLEKQVSQVIHSQAGHIASQREKISLLQHKLQEELTVSQNRIAEQEKEIRWLKKALEETSQAAEGLEGSKEKERLMQQKVIEAWQAQAKTVHQELSTVVRQAEELQELNAKLNAKLGEVEGQKAQMEHELEEEKQESAKLVEAMQTIEKEKDALQELNDSMQRAYQDAKRLMQDQVELVEKKNDALYQYEQQLQDLDEELQRVQESANETQNKALKSSSHLSERIHDLERDKAELTERLNSTLASLEKRTGQIIEDANGKVKAVEDELAEAIQSLNAMKAEKDNIVTQQKQMEANFIKKLEEKDDLLDAAHDQLEMERDMVKKQQLKMMNMEEMVEEFKHKMNKMKDRQKLLEDEKAEALRLRATSEREWMDKMDAAIEDHDDQLQRIVDMHEKDKEEALNDSTADLQAALQEAVERREKDLAEAAEQHQADLQELQQELLNKDDEFRRRIQETEKKVEQMIEDSVDESIRKLEAKHLQELQKLKDKHAQEMEAGLEEQRQKLLMEKEKEIDQIKRSEAEAKAAEVENVKQKLKSEVELVRKKSANQLKALTDESLQEKERIQKDHEKKIDSLSKTHLLTQGEIDERARQETQEKYEQKLKDLKERHRMELAEQLENERGRLLAAYKKEMVKLGGALSQASSPDKRIPSTEEEKRLLDLAVQARTRLLDDHHEEIAALRDQLAKQAARDLEEQRIDLESKHENEMTLERKLLAVQSAADLQKQIHAAVEDALVEQEQELNHNHRKEILALKDQLAKEHAEQEDGVRHEFNKEKEKLHALHKQELHELRQALEDTQRSTEDEKGKLVADLKEQLALQTEKYREQLDDALNKQQEELLDKQRKEAVKLRNELQEAETRHQNELNEALQKHLQELSQQRKQLEAGHVKLVENLQEELAAAKDKCAEALSLAAAKDSESTATLMDQRALFEEQLKKAVEEKEKQFRIDQEATNDLHASEVARLRGQIEKLKTRHENDMKTLEQELLDEKERALGLLKEKHSKELAESHSQQAEDLETQLLEAQSKYRQELVRLREDMAQEKGELMSDADRRVKELSQLLQQQKREFDSESAKIKEEQRLQQELIQNRHSEDAAKLETLQQELERSLKTKHKQQLRMVKDDAAAEIERNAEEARKELLRRDESYQKEINQLKEDAQQESDELKAEIAALKDELEITTNNHSNRIQMLQDELEKERQSHGDYSSELGERFRNLEEEYAKTKDRAMLQEADLKRQLEDAETQRQATEKTNEEERAALKDQHQRELQEIKRNYDRQKEDYKEQIADLLQQNQKLRNAMNTERDAALKDTQDRYESKLHALEDDLLSERAHNEALKNKYERLLTQSRDVYEEEKESIKTAQVAAARREIQQKDAAIEEMKADHETELKDLQKQHEKTLQQMKDRIAELTEELENLDKSNGVKSGEIVQALEDERRKAGEERNKHNRDMQNLRAALTEQKQIELKELEDDLKRKHQKELDKALEEQHGNTNFQHQQLLVATKQVLQEELDNALAELRAAEGARKINRQKIEQLEDDLEAANLRIRRLKDSNEDLLKHNSKEMADREDKLRKAFDEEKIDMQAHFDRALRQNANNARKEIEQQAEELKAMHEKDLDNVMTRNAETVDSLAAEKGNEVKALQRQLQDIEDEKHQLQRQLTKAEAKKDAGSHELETLKKERQHMRDKIHALEMELVENGKQKFEARLQAEKDRIDNEYKDAFDQVKKEVEKKIEDNKALDAQLIQKENALAASQAAARSSEDERERMEEMFRRLLAEKDAQHERDLKHALEAQQDELQGGYLKLIQQQVEQLLGLIQSQANQPALAHVEDLQEKFMSLVQDLPDVWREKHGVFPTGQINQQPQLVTPTTHLADTRRNPAQQLAAQQAGHGSMMTPRTPLNILARESKGDHRDDEQAREDAVRRSKFGPNAQPKTRPNNLPWSSPSLRSSPMDQLIAAILDGDVQGIRAVVRAKGDDLKADYWRDLAKTILPLHRAVSGLHFHGSEKLLVSTIDTLAQLRADVNAMDHAGNSVLHKAIQVCTSKSAAAVVNTLLRRGADPTALNKDGDSPLHSECKRVRSASTEVIEALVEAGADVNARNTQNGGVTPLTLVLLRGASSTSTGLSLIGSGSGDHNDDNNLGYGLEISPSGRTLNLGGSISNGTDGDAAAAAMDPERSRVASRRVWLKAAEVLCKQGAQWDPQWSTPKGCGQLHLFLSAFPPPRDESAIYRKLLKTALDSGLDPSSLESGRRRTALFLLCEQMVTVGSDQCPDSTRLMHMLLDALSAAGKTKHDVVYLSDRTGRTVLDIADSKVDNSCYAACKPLLRDASFERTMRGSSRGNVIYDDERPRTSSAIAAGASDGSFPVPSMSSRRNQHSASKNRAANTTTPGSNYSNSSPAYLREDYPAVPLLSQGHRSRSNEM